MLCDVKRGINAFLQGRRTSKSVPKTHKFFLENRELSLYQKIILSSIDEKLKKEFQMQFYILACRFKYESRIDGEDQKVLKKFREVLVEVLNS